jgi:hypothetical protein
MHLPILGINTVTLISLRLLRQRADGICTPLETAEMLMGIAKSIRTLTQRCRQSIVVSKLTSNVLIIVTDSTRYG